MIKITGALILLFFYAVFFGKMLLQRKKGIKTDQMAKGSKPRAVMRIERLVKIVTYGIVTVEIASIVLADGLPYPALTAVGIVLCAAGDLIFFTAVYTMRDSWRAGIPSNDSTEMVASGIYAYSRNPAFLGFDLVYIGLLILFFNWVHLFFVLLAIVMLHLQVLQEEKFLPTVFGEEYAKYRSKVNRYLGRK